MDSWKRCRHCLQRRDKHGSAENPHRPFACPGNGREPAWPRTIKDEQRAGRVFDERLARFWTQRETSFEAARG